MAGFAVSTPAPLALPAPAARDALSRPSLPNGPCNYRDLAFGECGCDQFWDKCSAEIHDGSKEHRPSSERSTWCVCGHHACFHLKEPRVPELRQPPQATVVCRVHAKCDGRICQLQTGSQRNAFKGVPSVDGERQSPEGSQAIHNGQLRKAPSGLAQQLLSLGASPTNTPARSEHGRRTPSQASTSGLPRVPSVCLLSNDRRPAANSEVRQDVNQSRHSVTGLGLSLLNLDHLGNSINHQQSVSPTVPDDVNIDTLPIEPYGGQDASVTKPISVPDEHEGASSQARGALDQIVEFNHNLQLDIGSDTIPNTLNPEDFIQSATEIATPSNANTPDLGAADCAVSEGKKFIETLTRLTSDMEQRNGSPSRPTTSATSAPSPQLLLTNSPGTPQEQLQQILQAASPKAFQKLVSYLAPLHSLLNSIPNVASTMQEFGSRLDLIENGSFNYVQPDELQHSLDLYEGRILELENRMDEHDRLHQAIDADQSSNSLTRRRVATISDSFGSNQSFQSTTSSALVLAAMDRKDMEHEIGGIKDRLEVLEAAALPSAINPWEVEIVLLPWGHDLRGIWFSPDEPMHDSAKTTTQDSEEWTQARSSSMTHGPRPLLPNTSGTLRDTDSSPQPSSQMQQKGSLFSDSESGWSSQAISDWASGSVDDWLFPKACGKTNMVYKRLQSRGFIRDVKLSSASARDIQVALANAFSDLLEHLRYTEEEEDQIISSYPGLRASFIPLRKVFKESKLRFLTPAEMSSSALWSAQFLASGVMMRVSGGKKRLYVTQREAYIQPSDQKGSSWAWPEVRQLPRFSPDQDCQMEGTEKQNQPQVAEADAKEACWSYVEAYDAPPASVNSSFGSNHSVQLSMRPADRQWRRSITPSSILKNRQLHPISPLSENHPQRPRVHNRTVSASAVEQAIPGSSKRRLEVSPVKQSSAPHTVSRAPSMSLARLKRRRVTNSSSPKPDHMQEAQITFWNNTPRRSREPQSPFFSSTPGLPRSNSDVASRPSQRSIAVVGKSTPFAYATPHSGPFIGGPGFEEYGPGGGDTEPDDEDGSYDSDDGEQSWGGVTDGEDISAAVSEEPASFLGDDSSFGTENGGHDDDDDDQSEEDNGFGAQRRHVDEDDEDDEEEDGDVFDTLLEVLQH